MTTNKIEKSDNDVLSDLFIKNTLLPNRVFRENINIFLAFKPTLIQDSFFFNGLIYFLKRYNQQEIIAGEFETNTVFTMNVEQVNYEYWTNKIFTMDGLFYAEIGITSESLDWDSILIMLILKLA